MKNIPERRWVRLIGVDNSVAADSLDVLLRSFDIPTLIRPDGAGGYMEVYMGSTNLGVDILVPDDEFEKASEIVQAYASRSYESENSAEDFAEEPDESYNETFITGEANPEKKISVVKWVIGIVAVLAVVGFIFACSTGLSFSLFGM